MVTPRRGRSPQFMRRVQNRPALRRRSDLAVFMQLSLVALGVAVGGGLAWAGANYVQHNETFRVNAFLLEDVPERLRPAVDTVLAPAIGTNLLTIDLAWVHRQVSRIPAVQSVEVRRVLPTSIHVAVEVRAPVALLRSPDWTRPVSRDGVVLGSATDHLQLLRVVAVDRIALGNDRRLPESVAMSLRDAVTLVDWLQNADPVTAARVEYVRVEQRGLVAVLDAPTWELVFGDASDLEAKLEGLRTTLDLELPPSGSSIDLRYGPMVVVQDLEAQAKD